MIKRAWLKVFILLCLICLCLGFAFGCTQKNDANNNGGSSDFGDSTWLTEGSNGLSYKIIPGRDEYAVAGIKLNTTANIAIPSTHKGLPVTEIASGAFKGSWHLTSIKIPASVTVIGKNAFLDCKNLETVKMSNGVKVI